MKVAFSSFAFAVTKLVINASLLGTPDAGELICEFSYLRLAIKLADWLL